MLVRHKTPTAESFYAWLNQFPDSGYPLDEERYYHFVRTAIANKAKRWLRTDDLRNRILNKRPNFDKDVLERILSLVEHLRQFHGVKPLAPFTLDTTSSEQRKNHFLEIEVSDAGDRRESWKPESEWSRWSHRHVTPFDQLIDRGSTCLTMPPFSPILSPQS